MRPVQFLRVEGLAGALAVYATLDGPLWLLAVLGLALDLSMLVAAIWVAHIGVDRTGPGRETDGQGHD